MQCCLSNHTTIRYTDSKSTETKEWINTIKCPIKISQNSFNSQSFIFIETMSEWVSMCLLCYCSYTISIKVSVHVHDDNQSKSSKSTNNACGVMSTNGYLVLHFITILCTLWCKLLSWFSSWWNCLKFILVLIVP